MLIQKRAKLKITLVQNFALFLYQNFNFQRFQGAPGVGPYMSFLTDGLEQRNKDGVHLTITAPQIFPRADQKQRREVLSQYVGRILRSSGK